MNACLTLTDQERANILAALWVLIHAPEDGFDSAPPFDPLTDEQLENLFNKIMGEIE